MCLTWFIPILLNNWHTSKILILQPSCVLSNLVLLIYWYVKSKKALFYYPPRAWVVVEGRETPRSSGWNWRWRTPTCGGSSRNTLTRWLSLRAAGQFLLYNSSHRKLIGQHISLLGVYSPMSKMSPLNKSNDPARSIMLLIEHQLSPLRVSFDSFYQIIWSISVN